MKGWLVGAVAAACAIAWGCGGHVAPSVESGDGGTSSSSSGSSGSSSGGVGSSSGGSSGSSSGGSSGGSSSGGSSSGSSSGGTGQLVFEQCSGPVPWCLSGTSMSFSAAFSTGNVQDMGCKKTTVGACSFSDCTTHATQSYVGAGNLQLTYPGQTSSLTLTPDATNQYAAMLPGAVLEPGMACTVQGSGGVVPAFGPVSLEGPVAVGLTAPNLYGSTLSVGADLQVDWVAGAPGDTMVFEGQNTDGTQYFQCFWDAALQSQVVPASVMAPLQGQAGYVIYGQYASTTITVGGWSIMALVLPYFAQSVTYQ